MLPESGGAGLPSDTSRWRRGGHFEVVSTAAQKQGLAFQSSIECTALGACASPEPGVPSSQQGLHLWDPVAILKVTLFLCLAVREDGFHLY